MAQLHEAGFSRPGFTLKLSFQQAPILIPVV